MEDEDEDEDENEENEEQREDDEMRDKGLRDVASGESCYFRVNLRCQV